MSKQIQVKKQNKTQSHNQNEFEQFESLTKNLLSVSNAEMREKMAEEKRKKEQESKQKTR
jgi:hypothetical protein